MTSVLVVGAGPTGLTAASELARHGVAVRIIDRAPTPAATSRALVVQPRTLEVFDDMGVVDDAISVGNDATRLTIVFKAASVVAAARKVPFDIGGQLTGPQNHTAYPALRTLSQHDTERLLANRLAEQGVDIERGWALTDLVAHRDAVIATLHGPGGATEAVHCRWVIGCDGAHSAVRKAVGIPFVGSTYHDQFIMADAELDWELPHGGLYVFPSPAGVFAAFSMPGENRYRIFGNVPPVSGLDTAECSEPTHDEFVAMIAERVPFAATVVREHWVSRYRVHARSVPTYRDGRVFLAGDAAHVHSPAGAQGMNTGIQDAYNLAWKLALVERGIASDELLASYQAERHPVGVALLRTTDRLFSIVAGDHPVARVVRGRIAPLLAAHLVSRRIVRRRLAGRLAQLRVHYPNSPLNAQDGTGWRAAAAPGDRAREADVVIGGQRGRLYDVFRGTHHTVLLFAGLGDEARPAGELCRVAERIEQVYPDLVRARVITAGPDEHPAVLVDADGSAHRQYGISWACAYVVRPDTYIGYRGRPVGAERILADLVARLPVTNRAPATGDDGDAP